MIDVRITDLLKRYYKCRKSKQSNEILVLEHRYNNCFAEIKYLYESTMSLGSLDYDFEHNRILEKIEELEEKLLKILIQLISLSE